MGVEAIAGAEPVPASVDASFRRYFRLEKGGRSLIVMDAPPEKEDSVPFIRVAGFLESMGLNAPRVLEADLERGFLLLNDLGSTQYLARLREEPTVADRLYDDALDALSRMQLRGAAFQAQLPPYDEELLEWHANFGGLAEFLARATTGSGGGTRGAGFLLPGLRALP